MVINNLQSRFIPNISSHLGQSVKVKGQNNIQNNYVDFPASLMAMTTVRDCMHQDSLKEHPLTEKKNIP